MRSPVHVRCIQATNWITIENVKITSLKWNKIDAWEPSKHWCQLNGFQGVCELDVNATYPSEPELLTVLPLWFKVLTPTKSSILSNNTGLNNVDSLYFLLINYIDQYIDIYIPIDQLYFLLIILDSNPWPRCFHLPSKHSSMLQHHLFWMETERLLDHVPDLGGQLSMSAGQDTKTSSWCEP